MALRKASRVAREGAGNGRAWLVGLFVLASGLALIRFDGGVSPALLRGDPAPDFELPTLAGTGPTGPGAQRGQVVLLNFWASWCGPCRSEMPALERLYRELHDEGFELLAISVDRERADVEAYRDALGLSFPILLDPSDRVSPHYQTVGVPESFLLDREGRLVERYGGPRAWDRSDYVDRIRRLLAPEG